MASPEIGGAGASAGWIEGFGAFLLLILTLGGQAWRYLRESHKDDVSPKHMVLEAGEIADMAPIRDLAKKFGEVYPLVKDTNEKVEEALRILQAGELEAKIAKGVEERLRDERMRADREAQDRDRNR